MAVFLPSLKDTFEVVIERDSALSMTSEEYKEYLDSKCNKTFLKKHEGKEPTIFVMRKVLPFELAEKVQNKQMNVSDKGKMNFQMAFMLEEIRASLIDIINAPDVPTDKAIKFTKDSDGGASEDLIAILHAAGIVQELYNARSSVLKDLNGEELKKK